MFFLLKCAFWLALVYAAMLYGFGPIKPMSSRETVATRSARQDSDITRAGHTVAEVAVADAASGMVALCAHRPTDCLADAARLEALFESSGSIDPVALGRGGLKRRHADAQTPQLDTPGASPVVVEVPMPIADPRRQRRVSRLTP